MKKIFIFFSFSVLTITGCNRTIVDTTWDYKYADINGVGTVEVGLL